MDSLSKKPILSFVVAAVLMYLVFGKLDFLAFQLAPRLSDWLHLVGLAAAFTFSLISTIKGIKQIKQKENSFILNLIAIIGGTIIGLLILYWLLLILLLNVG
jgi:hypothetical protein